jgi:hypothetical protein
MEPLHDNHDARTGLQPVRAMRNEVESTLLQVFALLHGLKTRATTSGPRMPRASFIKSSEMIV